MIVEQKFKVLRKAEKEIYHTLNSDLRNYSHFANSRKILVPLRRRMTMTAEMRQHHKMVLTVAAGASPGPAMLPTEVPPPRH